MDSTCNGRTCLATVCRHFSYGHISKVSLSVGSCLASRQEVATSRARTLPSCLILASCPGSPQRGAFVELAPMGWCDLAGALHPAEFISLRRKDLMLPAVTGFVTEAIYVSLRNPKTARFARRQRVKISDPDVIRFVVQFF